MTRKEAMRLNYQSDVLRSLGFTSEEADKLRRISMTLHRWHELECGIDGGCVERDEETGKTFWLSESGRRWSTADRETGAKKRLVAIIGQRNSRSFVSTKHGFDSALPPNPLSAFIQTDPRGAALYILRPGDVPEGEDVSSYYSRGICVY